MQNGNDAYKLIPLVPYDFVYHRLTINKIHKYVFLHR